MDSGNTFKPMHLLKGLTFCKYFPLEINIYTLANVGVGGYLMFAIITSVCKGIHISPRGAPNV